MMSRKPSCTLCVPLTLEHANAYMHIQICMSYHVLNRVTHGGCARQYPPINVRIQQTLQPVGRLIDAFFECAFQLGLHLKPFLR